MEKINMEHVSSYPEVYQLGHKAITGIFDNSVIVEEKIDGSQFSFGVLGGELVCRSHNKQLLLDAPEKMFIKAVEIIKSIQDKLTPEWIYRGEYLNSPKHNTLVYSRTPKNNIILFDIMTAPETYLPPQQKEGEAHEIGLECVPLLYVGKVTDFEMFKGFLERDSVLGGTKIEGVVIKNYELFTQEKKCAMGKYVSEAFKEVHDKDWKERNPTGKDFIESQILWYRTEARWNKAIIHLKEADKLEGSPKDIGLLIREIPADILKECGDEIKDALFKHFWPSIQRGIIRGVPEFYKDLLAKSAFEEEKHE
jgi:ATP-dependent RNA circularization protein (DNA/RNA ligase family)